MIVDTTYGKLNGKQENGYAAFLGIPYAKPPVGELRWREPQPPEPWDGVRDALEFSAIAPQAPSQAIPGNDPADGGLELPQSEDCLYLNIWSPDLDPKAKLPVFFWIHGGAYCCGSGNQNNASPEPFCSRGVILVTMNYRLGLLGYFAHPQLDAESEHGVSSNYAHFDQLAALKWVKENIKAFGGDPENITVGGCSAGAGSTQVLCCSPLAEGLFARAIVESGVGLDCLSLPEEYKVDTLEELEKSGAAFMEKLGCKTIDEMRALSYEALIRVPECEFRRKYHYGTTLGLCRDGYLLPERSVLAMQTLQNHNIPYLIGTTADEGGGMSMFMTVEKLRSQLFGLFGGDTTKELLEAQPLEGKEDLGKFMHDLHTGHCAAKSFAEIQAKYGRKPVYVFSFAHPNPANGQAHHGLETAFLQGKYPYTPETEEAARQVAAAVQDYWCNFIKTGNPNNGELPIWRPYTEDDRCVLIFRQSAESGVELEHPLQKIARSFAVNRMEDQISAGERPAMSDKA